MRGELRVSRGIVLGAALSASVAGLLGLGSCGGAPAPFLVTGPGQTGNEVPTLNILEPNANITRGQGDPFRIHWTDQDRDDNAKVSFSLVSTTTNAQVLLVSGISENDTLGPDSFTASTTLIAPGTYNLLGVIDDSVNDPVSVFATVAGATTAQRVVVRLVPPGEGQQSVPPTVVVTQPQFDLSVTQDDTLNISVQPTALAPGQTTPPYDPDSTTTLYILLDTDLLPTNDQPANPDPEQIIVLRQQDINAAVNTAIPFEISINLDQIPARVGGDPYFIRATITDSTNTPVHSYAPGKISIVQLAAGVVDLFEIGRTKSGAKFQGFTPGAQLGSKMTTVGDFDADLVDDFVLVARFGNPQNVGPVGEAYLVYGQGRPVAGQILPAAGDRFGGTISVNAVSDTISGVIFQAPPVRSTLVPSTPARTDGIVDASFMPDVTGDGRPELLFGLPHVHGAYDTNDYDPEDVDIVQGVTTFDCYPDPYANNFTDGEARDVGFYAGGFGVVINSQNRDADPRIEGATRLESTAVVLEYAGQFPKTPLAGEGESASGFILPRADNAGVGPDAFETDEPGRIAGARFIGGSYDFVGDFFGQQGPREDQFGQSVRSIGDLTADGVPEFVVSAPRNERYLEDLKQAVRDEIDIATEDLNELCFLSFFVSGGATHLCSTSFTGSIIVFPGTNYNQIAWRDLGDEAGASNIPFLDQAQIPPFGQCTAPTEPRHFLIPAETFAIFAEDIDDFLGEGQSAGDFNQDGLDDLLCGAPLNNRDASQKDTGAAYIIYGRTLVGEIHLSNADNTTLRSPMLRIRGEKIGDQIGWRQTAGLDVNGDRIDDVFIGSPRADWGPITRTTCGTDFDGDRVFNANDLRVSQFNTCRSSTDELFSDDACKAYDYDNDGDVDDDDRCVFCCLSGECEPDDSCIFGQGASCCDNLVDNGFVGIIFGGVFTDGDRTLTQLATPQLPGVVFHGNAAGDRAGLDVSSAGDFNQDGFGDILIAAPGEVRKDVAGRDRLGVVYLIFGGPHLINKTFNLKTVGTAELPGIVFLSPYVKGRPNEAAPMAVAFIGDINHDGFGDIAVGNPFADFIDPSFPQGPNAPGTNPATGRRSNVGDAYVIYGNNFGSNRAVR